MAQQPTTAYHPSKGAEPIGIGSAYKWQVVAMLWCVCFLNYADRQSIFSVFPVLKKEFGFDPVEVGWIGSAFMWVYAAGAPLAGAICDRLRRKPLILGGCLFWSLITMSTGWCRSLWQFITVRALEGFGETFYFPASMSLLSDYHDKGTRSTALGWHQSSVYAGTVAGGWLGAWFAEKLGWQSGFYFFGGAGIVLSLVLLKSLREPKRTTTSTPTADQMIETEPQIGFVESLKLFVKSPTVVLLMLGFVCANFVAAIFLAWTPTFLVEKFNFRLTTAGLSGAAFIHLGSACSVPIAGMIADRLCHKLPAGRIYVQVAGLLLGAPLVFIVGQAQTASFLLLAMAAFGICKGIYDSGIFASLFDAIDPAVRGKAAGMMNMVGWGGGALGPLFVGYVAKHGHFGSEMANMSGAISAGSAFYLLGAILLTFAAPTLSRRRHKAAGN